jgi:phosphoribosylanthranilate isomerase
VSVKVKICGLRDAESVAACVAGGASYAGFVFYPRSPRNSDAATVAPLIAGLPESLLSVGLFVDAGDDDFVRVLRTAPLRMLQLHGAETPERVEQVKRLTGLPVIKAIGIADAGDVETARLYEHSADMLLLDARPRTGDLPGGNARAFDWGLLKNQTFSLPWMLAGGLNAGNIGEAAAQSGARIVDVSSGVEDAPGVKNIVKISRFLQKAAEIETCC